MDRECNNCIYHTEKGCTKWECEGTVTVEDVEKKEKRMTEVKYNIGGGKEIIAEYDENGIMEITRECFEMLIKKEIPKKPILKERHSLIHVNKGDKPHEWISDTYMDWCCPVCDCGVGERYIPRIHDQQKLEYCPRCGQRIDWEGVKNDRAD